MAGAMEAPATQTERRLKVLRKKLRQIEELKQKSSSLDGEAQKKIDSEQAIRSEIASLESPEADTPGGADAEPSLFEEIERAVADVPSHAALLLGASEKPFRELLKSLREAVKLQGMERRDRLQEEKLQRLTEEAPSLLGTFLPLRAEAMELAAGYDERQVAQLRANRVAFAAAREAAVAAAAAEALAARAPRPRGAAPPPEHPPRIGVDVGGVLNKFLNDAPFSDEKWELMPESEAPGAMAGLARCVQRFGSENVFILSKCSGEMRRKTEVWLFETMRICGPEIGVRRRNVLFCTQRFGRDGKGSLAEPLRLSHFVDDRDDCLWSVYVEGRSQAHVDRHGGRFFHMSRGGSGRWPPQPREWSAQDRPACVTAVRDWSEVLRQLGID